MSKYSWFALLLFPVLGYVGAKKGGERVLLDDIATASDFTAEKLLGKWYARKINYGANLPTKLAMLEIYQGRGDLLHHRCLLHVPETDTCRVQDKLLSPSCGEYIGEFNLGHPSRKTPGRWGSYKVLTLTDTVLAMLVCFKEKMDGTCDKSGLHGAIWSREPKQPIKHFGTLKQLYSDVGFDNNNWETPTDGVCNEALLDGPKYVDSGNNSLECRAMDVPSVPDFSPSGVNGYWYTIAHLGLPTTASYHYSGEFEGSVGITTAGLNSDGECEEQVRVIWRPRCSSSPDFGHLSRMVIENKWSYGITKILYSDYDTALVVYICLAVDDGGYCPSEKQRVYMLSRTPTLDPALRDQLNDVVRTACVDPNRLMDADQTSPETDPQQWFTDEIYSRLLK
ncbi:hypothetical protein ScPMuIL_012370 [Solemya velum]